MNVDSELKKLITDSVKEQFTQAIIAFGFSIFAILLYATSGMPKELTLIVIFMLLFSWLALVISIGRIIQFRIFFANGIGAEYRNATPEQRNKMRGELLRYLHEAVEAYENNKTQANKRNLEFYELTLAIYQYWTRKCI